jgi:hypothetical protein
MRVRVVKWTLVGLGVYCSNGYIGGYCITLGLSKKIDPKYSLRLFFIRT